MTPPSESSELAQFTWRLGELEKKVERIGSHLDERLNAITTQISSLGFVRLDVYMAEQRAAENAYKSLAAKVDETDRKAMWAIALVVTVTIGAIVTGILSLSGVFK